MLRIRKFTDWHAAALSKIRATRTARIRAGEAHPGSLDNQVSLQSISLAAVLDEHFDAFAKAVGGRSAETFLVRVLQYVAHGHATTGDCPADRGTFGTLVLSRRHDIVNAATGAKVYDALIACGIAIEVNEGANAVTACVTDRVTAAVTDEGTDVVTDREAIRARSRPVPSRPVPSLPVPSLPPPTPTAQGVEASASPLSAAERRQLLAGCGALAIDESAPKPDRLRARSVFEGLRAKTIETSEARAITELIHRYTNSRCAWLAAAKAGAA